MQSSAKTAPANTNGSTNASTKLKPIKALPTYRINFKKQIEMLRAYAVASGPDRKPITNKALSELVAMHENTTAVANPFFVENGFLQRGEGGFTPAEEVFEFARAYEWNADTASYKLGPLVERSWFAQALMPKLRYQPLEKKNVIDELAGIAKAGPDYEGQLETILEYMVAAGLVQCEGSLVKAKSVGATNPGLQEKPISVGGDHSAGKSPAKVSTLFSQPTEGAVQFQVNVRVDMSEFAGWDPTRITAFFGGIAQVLAAKGAIEKKASGE